MPFRPCFLRILRYRGPPRWVTQVMIVETDLHLNAQHPSYDSQAVNRLISAAKDYAGANMQGLLSFIRLVSTRNGEI